MAMPRPRRADEANAISHTLNRGNLRVPIFQKDGDYIAFEKILSEGLTPFKPNALDRMACPLARLTSFARSRTTQA